MLQHLLPDDGPTSPSLEMIGGVQTLGEGSHHFSDYADYSGPTGPTLGMPPTSPPLSFPPPAVLSPQSHASTVPVLQYSPPQMGHQSGGPSSASLVKRGRGHPVIMVQPYSQANCER